MDEAISDRLLDQRLRNLIMEELLCLVLWANGLERGLAFICLGGGEAIAVELVQ